ncbi:MAG: hypothetical protein ABI557_03375 [Aureliella sp.]
MYPSQLFGVACVVFLCSFNCELLLAQEPEVEMAVLVQQDTTQDHSIIKILAEPKTSRPFNWERGEKVTVGVRCITDGETRVMGVATGVELVAIRPFENRVEMMLRADVNSIEKIETAAKISEFWFEIMPFEEEHRKTLNDAPDFREFLIMNPKYHAATDSDWGYGAGKRLEPPANDELPTRKTGQKSGNDNGSK